jgi:type I restriction enzyme, S subunit
MSWTEAPLRRIFRIVNGGTPTNDEQYWNGDVPWATPVDIGLVDGKYLNRTQRCLSEAGVLAGSRTIPIDSLVVSTRAPIGYVAQTSTRMAFNQGCRGLIASVPADMRYFRYQLLGLRDDLIARGAGSTFMELSTDSLASVSMLLPSLDEQRRIADFLDAETARIDSLAITQGQARAILLERRAALVFKAVTCGVIADRKPSNLAWVESIPATWESVKLGHFARMGSGHTPSRSHPEWWENCTVPWITTGEVSQVRDDRREILTETRERISEIGLANSAAELCPKDTVVLCRTASAGYSAVMGENMATSQDFVTWKCGPRLDPFYLLWCLRAMRSDLLGRLAMGSTHKTIYVPDLQMLRVPLPPLAEQHRIVEYIRANNATNDVALDAIDRQLALLAERRQAIIAEAVTGQIDVTTARGGAG